MTSDDWVFERQRDYPLSYVLTGADREYLQNKRKSDHPRSDPEERIQNRVEKLPDRIQDLIIDLWLLDDDGRLSGECWSDLKNEVGDFSQAPLITDELVDYEELHSQEFIFGNKMGNALKSLNNPGDEDSDLWLLWGIIVALIGKEAEQHPDQKSSFSPLQNFIQERIDKRHKRMKQVQEYEQKADKAFEIRIQRINYIHDILIEYGLDPNPGINRALFRGIDANPIESTEVFCRELECLLNDTPLEQTNKLERSVNSDLDAVLNKNIQGVSAQAVFEAVIIKSTDGDISSGSNPINRTEIERYLDNGIDKRSFTRVLKFLADKYDRYQWPRYPVITKSESGWEASQYGILLEYCDNGPHPGTTWMYKPWIFPEYATDGWKEYVLSAINETSFEEHDHQSILKYNPHFQDV